MDVKIEALKLLKQLFTKQNFADAKLSDGTIVSAEAFEPGQDLFIIDELGERIPAPDGEHTLEDGTKVMVEGGKIKELVKQEVEDGIKEDVEIKEDLQDEVKKEIKEDELLILKNLVDELMGKVNKIEEEMGKMKMSSDEVNERVINTFTEIEDKFSKIPAAEKVLITPTFDSKIESDSIAKMRVLKNS